MSSELTDFLKGFEFVESDGLPVITLDKHHRFYINTTARRLMNVKPYDRLSVAYNSTNKTIAIIKSHVELTSTASAHAATSVYNVDRRYYLHARHFTREYGYDKKETPSHFVYERGVSSGVAFAFRLNPDLIL